MAKKVKTCVSPEMTLFGSWIDVVDKLNAIGRLFVRRQSAYTGEVQFLLVSLRMEFYCIDILADPVGHGHNSSITCR